MQGPAGGAVVKGVVSDVPESFVGGDIQPLSLTPQGRLRVSSVDAPVYIKFFDEFNFADSSNIFSYNSPWEK